MNSSRFPLALAAGLALALPLPLAAPAAAQERLPWGPSAEAPRTITPYDDTRRDWERDPYRQPPPSAYGSAPARRDGPAYEEPPARIPVDRDRQSYERAPYPGRDEPYRTSRPDDAYRPPAAPYAPPPPAYDRQYDNGRGGPAYYDPPPPPRRADYDRSGEGTFSMGEIRDAGHSFFGTLSQGLASVIEYAFSRQGRPNGYILGEDLGGAFVAGLRYGEGVLYTRDAGNQKVFWQGPSIGFDAGAEGSKVMVLVYNLRHPGEIYERFGGVDGSAYMVGGAGLTFLNHNHVILAPIRTGIGLRLGANIGYLKYTRRPTWNPF